MTLSVLSADGRSQRTFSRRVGSERALNSSFGSFGPRWTNEQMADYIIDRMNKYTCSFSMFSVFRVMTKQTAVSCGIERNQARQSFHAKDLIRIKTASGIYMAFLATFNSISGWLSARGIKALVNLMIWGKDTCLWNSGMLSAVENITLKSRTTALIVGRGSFLLKIGKPQYCKRGKVSNGLRVKVRQS